MRVDLPTPGVPIISRRDRSLLKSPYNLIHTNEEEIETMGLSAGFSQFGVGEEGKAAAMNGDDPLTSALEGGGR